jgi:hypothetical protein
MKLSNLKNLRTRPIALISKLEVAPKDLVILAVSSLTIFVPKPFFSNQNQYFIHVIAPTDQRLNGDWLAGTADTNQFFTLIFTPIFNLFGSNGIQALTYPLYFFGLVALYVFVTNFFPIKNLALSVVIFIALLQSPILSYLLKETSLGNIFVPLQGFGGQYIFSRAGYIQPASIGGTFLMIAIVLMIKQKISHAIICAFFACMFHPSLLFGTVILAFIYSLFIFQWDSRYRCLLRLTSFSLTLFLLTIICNPNLIYSFQQRTDEGEALTRFAFERIPHHTLVTYWQRTDFLFALIWIFAIALCVRIVHSRVLNTLLISSFLISMSTAIFVNITRSTTLALMFPWRLSVVVAPLIYAIVIAVILNSFQICKNRNFVKRLMIIILPISAIAVYYSVSKDTYERVLNFESTKSLVGTGYIPLDLENMRLEHRLPIFVDWKSPPYLGRDLIEWWRRIDVQRNISESPELFCSINLENNFEWVLWTKSNPLPDCLQEYKVFSDSGAYRLFVRPKT